MRQDSRHHVSAADPAQERRQDARLLEHRGESTPRRRPGGAAAGPVFGRDRLVASHGVAQGDRGIRRGGRRAANLGAVSGGSLRGDRRRLGGSCLSLGIDAAPAAAMGRVLAGGSAVARAAIGPVLGRAAAAQPEGNALGPDSPGFGGVSADRPGQRMEVASRVVWQQRHGRPPGRRFRPGRSAQALRLSRPAAGAQGCIVFASGRALAGSVQRQLRCAALRSDQHLLRDRCRGAAGRRQAPARLQPRPPTSSHPGQTSCGSWRPLRTRRAGEELPRRECLAHDNSRCR